MLKKMIMLRLIVVVLLIIIMALLFLVSSDFSFEAVISVLSTIAAAVVLTILIGFSLARKE